MSLNKLADFLASRGLAGDAEQALGHYQRSLEVSERLLAANPESAQAARDVLVSLERQAKVEGSRAGGAEAALGLQVRSLDLALKLRERNSQSYHYQRTAAVSFWLTGQRQFGRRKPGTRIAMPRRLFQRARFVGRSRRRRRPTDAPTPRTTKTDVLPTWVITRDKVDIGEPGCLFYQVPHEAGRKRTVRLESGWCPWSWNF